jgi:hypothetical protein
LFEITSESEEESYSFESDTSLFEEYISLLDRAICPIDREDECHCLALEFLSDRILVFPTETSRKLENLQKEIIAHLVYWEQIIDCHSDVMRRK